MAWPLAVFAAAVAGCGSAGPEAGGGALVLVGATVRTLDAASSAAEAIAIAGGRVLAVGSEADVLARAGEGARVVRLTGGAVLPALADHHAHVLSVGLWHLNAAEDERFFVDLSGTRSAAEVAERLARRAADLPPGTWITGHGWNQRAWGVDTLPTHHVLTAALPHHPVWVVRSDAHAGWVNAAALQTAGLGPETPQPEGGRISRDASGAPSGILLEAANDTIARLVPSIATADLRRAFRAGADALAAAGVGDVYDAGLLAPPGIVARGGLDASILEALVAEAHERPLPLRVHLMVMGPGPFAEAVLADPAHYRSADGRLRVTHLKLVADGALGSRGAALTHPYADAPSTRGVLRLGAVDLEREAARALEAGLDVAIHAIGDRAVATVLDVYERLLLERPELEPARLRIEHFSYAREADIRRAVALGVVLSIQSRFDEPPVPGGSLAVARVGPGAAERVYPWKRLYEAGALLAEGTDAYGTPPLPLASVSAALTTRNGIGRDLEGDAGLTRALTLATTFVAAGASGPAGPVHRRLVPEAPADLVVLARDPWDVQPAELSRIRVVATISEGRLVAGELEDEPGGPVATVAAAPSGPLF